MATTEERMLILRMIEQGKISAEEGTRLLAALNKDTDTAPQAQSFDSARTLHVRVTELGTNRPRVNVALPAGLVSLALRWLPANAQREVAQVQAALDAGLSGKLLEVVDQEQGVRVEISVT